MTTFQFQIVLCLNLGAKIEDIKFCPFVGTQQDLEDKIDTYKGYAEMDYIDAECIDEYGNVYIMVLNKNLLQNSYFKFYNLGPYNGENER